MIVFLDSNIVIYAVENTPMFGAKATARLSALHSGGATFMASDLIRMECLVTPLRLADHPLASKFRSFLSATGMQVVPISAALCDRAALIRATYRFKPLDSLHLAAATENGANVFLTNDTRLNAFTGITVEILQ